MTAIIVLAALVFQAPTIEQQNSGTTVRLQAVSAVNDRVAWASGTGGTYTRTVDGGATWRAFGARLPRRDVQALAFDPSGNWLYAGLNDAGLTSIRVR